MGFVRAVEGDVARLEHKLPGVHVHAPNPARYWKSISPHHLARNPISRYHAMPYLGRIQKFRVKRAVKKYTKETRIAAVKVPRSIRSLRPGI